MKNESAAALAAYEYYASLPPAERTYARVAEDKDVPGQTVRDWAKKYNWASRLAPLSNAERYEALLQDAHSRLEKPGGAPKDTQAFLDLVERLKELKKAAVADDDVDVSEVWTPLQLRMYQTLHYIARRKIKPIPDAAFVKMVFAYLQGEPAALDALANTAYQ